MANDIVEYQGGIVDALPLRGTGGPIVVTEDDIRKGLQLARPVVTGIHRGIKRGYEASIQWLGNALEEMQKKRQRDGRDDELELIQPGDEIITEGQIVPVTTGGTGGVVRWTSSKTSRLVSSTKAMTTTRGGMPSTTPGPDRYLNGPTGTVSSMKRMIGANQKMTLFHIYHCEPIQESWQQECLTSDSTGNVIPVRAKGNGPALRWSLSWSTGNVYFEHPSIPNLTENSKVAGNFSSPQLSCLIFNVQWPGESMHEDPSTQVFSAPTTGATGTRHKYLQWQELTSAVNKNVAVSFSQIMSNNKWTKMVIYKVNLEMFLRNYYPGPVHVHVIFYQHKRKGMDIGTEAGQWWNNETASPMQAYSQEHFARFNRLVMKASCKIVKHDFFVIQGLNHNETWTDGTVLSSPQLNVKAFAHDGPNLHRRSYTFNQKHVLTRDSISPTDLVTNQDTWFRSTAVKEESMIYCAMYATPVGIRKQVVLNGTNAYNQLQILDDASGKQFPATTTAGTYNMPGVEVIIHRKTHIKVDKDIDFS